MQTGRMTARRIIIICYHFLVFLRMACTVKSETTKDVQHEWTAWYNSHCPTLDDTDDDESVEQIRQRGFDVCHGHFPLDVKCRDVHDHAIMFNSKTPQLAHNYLVLPCTTNGIICRNADQINGTCSDYEVQFECDIDPPTNMENMMTILVAAVVSILLPIVFLTALYILRRRRHSRLRQGLHNPSAEQSAQTEAEDLPPPYSVLFGEGVQNAQSVTISRTPNLALSVHTTDGNVEIQTSSSRQNNNTLEVISENSETSTISSQTCQERDGKTTVHSHKRSRNTASWRRKFPHLHLSMFEIFPSTEAEASSPTSSCSDRSSRSYTPPPSYRDAIFVLGCSRSVDEQTKHPEVPEGNDNQGTSCYATDEGCGKSGYGIPEIPGVGDNLTVNSDTTDERMPKDVNDTTQLSETTGEKDEVASTPKAPDERCASNVSKSTRNSDILECINNQSVNKAIGERCAEDMNQATKISKIPKRGDHPDLYSKATEGIEESFGGNVSNVCTDSSDV